MSRVPLARQPARQQREQLPPVHRVVRLHRHVGHQLRRLRLVHPLQDVVGGLLQLGSSQVGDDPLEQRQHLAPMNPPGQAQVLADGAGRQVGRAGRDVRLVAVDREIRRQRDLAVLARSLEVEVAIERAVEELRRDKPLSRFSSARPSASRYQRSWPSHDAASLRRASPTLSVGRLRNARISSRRTPASGSSAIASKMSRCLSAAGGSLASGFWYSTWPFSRQSRPSMRTACSRMRGSSLVDRRR